MLTMISGWLLYTCNECSRSQDVFLTIFNCTCSLSIICSVIKVQYLLVRLFLLFPSSSFTSALASHPVEHSLTVEVSLFFLERSGGLFLLLDLEPAGLVKLIIYHQLLPSFVCHLVSVIVTTTPNMT